MLDILGVGNANVDLMVTSDVIPENGSFTVLPGGSACNFAVGCARLGLSSGFAGFLGNDYFGSLMIKSLKNEGVKPLVRRANAETGLTVVFTKKYFKRFIKYPGANKFLDHLSLKPFNGKARHYHLATPSFLLFKQIGFVNKGTISVDPGGSLSKYSLDELRPWLSRIDFFIPNEKEARMITGLSYKLAAKKLLSAGVKNVIIKLSEKGCYFANNSESFLVKSLDFPVVDTTGAGDAFDSAFITARLRGLSYVDACRWGIISSNVCVTKLGAQTSARLGELKELYNKYYSLVK